VYRRENTVYFFFFFVEGKAENMGKCFGTNRNIILGIRMGKGKRGERGAGGDEREGKRERERRASREAVTQMCD